MADAPVILCFGDSLTAGYGLLPGQDYPSLLQRRLAEQGFPHRVVNAGLSGDTTAAAMQRLAWSLKSRPAIAIVVLGANDGFRGGDPDDMRTHLLAIIRKLQESGVRVLLGGMRIPPNYGLSHVERFAAVYPALAKETGVAFLPFFLEGVAGQPALNLEDGIHPNAAGYRKVLDTLWPVLLPLLTPSG
ncbi:MAG: arylesterase [Magnetococcales bacterium]|nr:arylesterase [Magnetococcales bacterium]